jgi:hypothetical protein
VILTTLHYPFLKYSTVIQLNSNTNIGSTASVESTYHLTMSHYFDPLGETEPCNTRYTLTVRCPPRPPLSWLPAILSRPGRSKAPNVGTVFTIRPSDHDPAHPNYDHFLLRHLDGMKKDTITIKSTWFPGELRCKHLQNTPKLHECKEGCYVLEKGGDIARWNCSREDCEGHVYCDGVQKYKNGVACFGKKGSRMVCVIR